MKKILLPILAAALFFNACKEDTDEPVLFKPDMSLENKADDEPYLHLKHGNDSLMQWTRIEESYMFGQVYQNAFKQGVSFSFQRNDTSYCLRINFVLNENQRDYMDGFALQREHAYSLKEIPYAETCNMTKGVEVEWYAYPAQLEGSDIFQSDMYFHQSTADLVQSDSAFFEVHGYRKMPPDGKFTWVRGAFSCHLMQNGTPVPVSGEFQARFYLN